MNSQFAETGMLKTGFELFSHGVLAAKTSSVSCVTLWWGMNCESSSRHKINSFMTVASSPVAFAQTIIQPLRVRLHFYRLPPSLTPIESPSRAETPEIPTKTTDRRQYVAFQSAANNINTANTSTTAHCPTSGLLASAVEDDELDITLAIQKYWSGNILISVRSGDSNRQVIPSRKYPFDRCLMQASSEKEGRGVWRVVIKNDHSREFSKS